MAAPNDVRLTWNAASDYGGSGVAEYRIRRSQDAGALAVVAVVPHTEAATYQWVDMDLADGTWFYRLTAVDAFGNESPFTDELNVTVFTGAVVHVVATRERLRAVDPPPRVFVARPNRGVNADGVRTLLA